MRRLPRLVAVIIIIFAAVWVGSRLVQLGGTVIGASKHVSANRLELDVPFNWEVNTTGWPSTGMGSTFAIVGTQPWGPCLPFDINCHYQQRLGPGQITVTLGLGLGLEFCETGATRSDIAARGTEDPVATGALMRVDTRPTIQTDYAVGRLDYYQSDEWRNWRIAAPGSTFYVYDIQAMYRGPDVAVFRSQLDAMIRSLRVREDPTLATDGPDDCGPPFPP